MKQLSLKKAIFLSGSVSAILISAGFFFRTLHWPFGLTMFTVGVMGVLLVFVPLTWFYYTESNASKSSSDKLRFHTGIASGLLIGLGWAFKTCHLPGANLMLLVGGTILTFAFLPMVLYHVYKKDTNNYEI